jgi:hypothetical protein
MASTVKTPEERNTHITDDDETFIPSPNLSVHNVLDLTGAAISNVEVPNAEHENNYNAHVSIRETVPSISLPRQNTGVRHFAMGE